MLGDLYLKLLEMLIKTFIICIEYYEALQNYYIIIYIMRYNPSSDYDYSYRYIAKIRIFLNYKNYYIIYFIQCIY